MSEIRLPPKVKLICGIMTRYEELFAEVGRRLEAEFGPIDLESDTFDFDFTDYYCDQMGDNIKRRFYSFEKLIRRNDISKIKIATNDIEVELAQQGKYTVSRPVNLDPGYLCESKLVLATTKDYAHRIYLDRGIYAEVTLKYCNGQFEPWLWTYPDFRTNEYISFFEKVRQTLRAPAAI